MVAISQNNEVLIIVQSGMENSLCVIFVTTGIKFTILLFTFRFNFENLHALQ